MVSIELSFGEIDGAMEPVVRSTDAIAQLDTVSSEINQPNTQKIATAKHQLTFDKTLFHCGEGEEIESNALGLFFE